MHNIWVSCRKSVTGKRLILESPIPGNNFQLVTAFLTRNPNSANRYPLRELKRPFKQQVFHEFNVQGTFFSPWKSFTFHAVFILLASFPFSKSKNTEFFK